MKLLILTICAIFCIAECIIPTEIMYKPRQTTGYEFIELYNPGPSDQDVSGWSFTDGVNFTFPSGSSIPIGGFAIIANNREKFLRAYPSVSPSIIYGNYGKKLSGKGETLILSNALGNQVFRLAFDDSWYPLTDGYGASLELMCKDADINSPNSWRASLLPTSTDPLNEFSGSPGSQSTWYTCPAPTTSYAPKPIYFSEVMYHPRLERTRIDFHEFIEFYNGGDAAIQIGGYRILSRSGKLNSIQFTFPSGSIVQPKSYFLVAKNKNMLNAVYSLASATIFGDYLGELSNSDGIALVDTNGQLVEEFEWKNDFPWPIGANNYFGDQYKGLSLERVSFGILSSKKYNWVASVPTPGVQNSAMASAPKPIVSELVTFQGSENNTILLPNRPIMVMIKSGPKGTTSTMTMEYFIDNISSVNEEKVKVVMSKGSDNINNNDEWSYTFANGFPENTVVKFRFYDATNTVISPRSNDPYEFHGIFITPIVDSQTPSYHLFIDPVNWAQLWKNLRTDLYQGFGLYEDLPASCCKLNPLWNNDVPALLGYNGQAFDVKAQYQGSSFNRARGTAATVWNATSPTEPDPLLILSWKIDLPDWVKIDGRNTLFLVKPRDHGCNYITTYVMYELSRELGIPAPQVRFSRLNINGGYYLYAMDLQNYDKDLIEDYIDDTYASKCSHQPSEEVGLVYKAGGYGCEGPLGPSNEAYLYPITNCGNLGLNFSTLSRVEETYELKTHKSWAGHENIVNMTDYLAGINALTFTEGNVAAREWFYRTFDVNHMLSYIALINWGGAWDDINGNHMLYQRLTDGKWTMALWDMDSFFGQAIPCKDKPSCSLYLGEEGEEVGEYQNPGGFNTLKDHFIKVFRNELKQRYADLAATALSIENVNRLFQEGAKLVNVNEYYAGALRVEFGATCVSDITSWHAQRHAFVVSQVGVGSGSKVDLCPSKGNATFINTFNNGMNVPGQPAKPYMAETDTNYIALAWDAPNSNGAEITTFILERKSSGDFSEVYNGLTRYYKDLDLESEVQYTYRLQAVNKNGKSVYSDPATFVAGQMGEVGVPGGNEDNAATQLLGSFISIFSILLLSILL